MTRRLGGACCALLVGFTSALVSGCGEEDDEQPVCEVSAEGQLNFTQVELEPSLSADACPVVTPEVLNAAPAGDEACTQTVSGCQLDVQCRVAGIVAEGALQDDEGVLFGRVQVSEPVRCSYLVEATLQ